MINSPSTVLKMLRRRLGYLFTLKNCIRCNVTRFQPHFPTVSQKPTVPDWCPKRILHSASHWQKYLHFQKTFPLHWTAKSQNTFSNNSGEFDTKIFFYVWIRSVAGMIKNENQRLEISWHCPFKTAWLSSYWLAKQHVMLFYEVYVLQCAL